MSKKQYYSIDNIMKTNAQYMILLGMRSNGKSYAAKKLVLSNAFKKHRKFVYLRRWDADIKENSVTSYFDDIPIVEITAGQYTGVMAYHGDIYFYNVDENDKIKRGEKIGRYCSLSKYERYKSQVFDGYDFILFEEFCTDGLFLDNEPRQLLQFTSTVFRNNEGKVILVGNTLNRVNPYFAEFALKGVLKQKPGTIEIYHYHVGESTINLAVEYCKAMNYKNTMFFGQAAKQILSGEWDTTDMPKLPDKQENFELVYKMLVEYQDFKFCLNLLVDKNGGKIEFIHTQTTTTKFDRILTDRFSTNPLISARLNLKRKAEQYISECFRLNKVCYSDNLTGSDFTHVNDHFKIATLF